MGVTDWGGNTFSYCAVMLIAVATVCFCLTWGAGKIWPKGYGRHQVRCSRKRKYNGLRKWTRDGQGHLAAHSRAIICRKLIMGLNDGYVNRITRNCHSMFSWISKCPNHMCGNSQCPAKSMHAHKAIGIIGYTRERYRCQQKWLHRMHPTLTTDNRCTNGRMHSMRIRNHQARNGTIAINHYDHHNM